MSKHPTLPDLLAVLASDCRNTEGWEDAAKTLDLSIIALDATTAELTRLRLENAEREPLITTCRLLLEQLRRRQGDELWSAMDALTCERAEIALSLARVSGGGK